MNDFHIGQIFVGIYPPEAADWCNSSTDPFAYIEEIEPAEDGTRRFQIKEYDPFENVDGAIEGVEDAPQKAAGNTLYGDDGLTQDVA